MPSSPAVAVAEPLRVEVERVIARPVAEVYRAWTTPEAIAEWFSPGNPGVRVTAEVRVGGALHIALTWRGALWQLAGRFLEVVPERRLAFTWVTSEVAASVGSVVTVEFTDLGGRTAVRLRHEGFPSEAVRADHDATGWQQILEVLVTAERLTPAALAAAAHAVAATAQRQRVSNGR